MQIDIPGGRLGDFVSLQRGTTYKSRLLGLPGPVLLGLASIQRNGGFRDDSLRTYGGDSPSKLLLEPGDLYVSLKDVTQSADLLGAVARVPLGIHGRLTQDTVKLIFKAVDAPCNYIYWLLRTPEYRNYCRAHSTGTTNLGLPRDNFLDFPVPPLTLQREALSALLNSLERKANLGREQNRTLDALASAMFKSWFVDFDPVVAKRDGKQPIGVPAAVTDLFPSHFDESELGPIPRGWLVGAVRDVCEFSYGKALPERARQPGSVPVLGSNGIVGSHVHGIVDGPGIVVGRKGTAGTVTWASGSFFPIDTTFYVSPRARTPMSWIYEMLRDVDLPHLSGDSAVPGLNRDTAHSVRIVLPPNSLLRHFDELWTPLRATQDHNEVENRTLAELRDALLGTLLSGELTLTSAEKAVGAAL